MKRVIVIVEGPTEERFVAGPLAESLWPRQVYLTPVILGAPLQEVRNGFANPEDINDGSDTAPSKRVLAIHRGYRKVIQGTLAAQAVGIDRMRRECEHFRTWFERLETLPGL